MESVQRLDSINTVKHMDEDFEELLSDDQQQRPKLKNIQQ
jgi:hypothetical protein